MVAISSLLLLVVLSLLMTRVATVILVATGMPKREELADDHEDNLTGQP